MATNFLSTHFGPLLLLFLWPHLLTALPVSNEDLVINTKHGKVQGKALPVLGSEVRAFLGIPYAKPPVGKLRFRAPEAVADWQGVKDATKLPNSCYQIPDTTYPGFKGSEMWNPNTPLSEDCLYLNVWTPRVNKTQPTSPALAPVLVWIYGGGFYAGTSTLEIYDGRFLSISEGVVVVSMNYRIGSLGFLSLPNNKDIRGNAGLLDQRLAIQWVVNNIAVFGGDPSKVTLFGESAGAASVGFHLISPGSQGLFQRAVMQSGSPNAPWATSSQTEIQQRAVKLASLLGCPTSNGALMETCLQKADPGKITSRMYEVLTVESISQFPFGPTVDGDFLPDTVEALLSSGSLKMQDVMFGLTKDEGTYFLMYIPGFGLSGENLISRQQFLKAVPFALSNSSDVVRQAAIFQYTDWSDEGSKMKNRDLLGSLVGDYMFCPLLEFAHRYSQRGGKSFLYSFDHRSSVNPWPTWMGVMHGYEIEFVFGAPLNLSLGYTKNEVNMTKKFMKHWANFARTGNPSLDGAIWPKFNPEEQAYVTLNHDHPQTKSMLKATECRFWNKLIPNIQIVSDDLLTCLTANGMTLCSSYTLLLAFLALTLTWF